MKTCSHVRSFEFRLQTSLQAKSLFVGSNMPSSPGSFSYPPPGSNLQFNCIDSVVASWVSFDAHATDCNLQLWYWNGSNPWLMGMSKLRPEYCQLVKHDLEFVIYNRIETALTEYTHYPQLPTKVPLQTVPQSFPWTSPMGHTWASSTSSTPTPTAVARSSLARFSMSIIHHSLRR